jgi:hypothetical protein
MEKKSVSVDINWGLRFKTQDQVDTFLRRLCAECTVSSVSWVGAAVCVCVSVVYFVHVCLVVCVCVGV